MRYLNLKLTSTKFMITHLQPNSADPVQHDHGNDFQISVPIYGAPFLQLNNHTTLLNKNSRMITSPGEQHIHFTESQESRILLININKNFLERVAASRLHIGSFDIDFVNHEDGSSHKLIKIADEVIRLNLLHKNDLLLTDELEWELAETLLSIQTGSHTEQWREHVLLHSHPIIKNVVDFIYENYASEITLEDLASESTLSKFYLIRTFKEVMGCTPAQFLGNRRLEKAKELLLTTELDVTTICFTVGFGSLATFERTFKKRFRCTVSEFRKKNNHLL